MTTDKVQGEGNYEAARKYDEATSAFAKDEDRVEKAAKDAEDALEGDEAEELERAEAEGKSHAKGLIDGDFPMSFPRSRE